MKDNFKGIVERGCPLCSWFGIVGAFPRHWHSHDLSERVVFNLSRSIFKKIRKWLS